MRETCRMPGCERPPGEEDSASPHRTASFCSVQCEVKYEHIKADAEDARLADMEEEEEEPC